MPSFLVAFLIAAAIHVVNFAEAAGEVEITGGSAIVGNTDTFLPINGVEVQGNAVGSVPISLKVDSGTLRMGTTTGLTFTSSTTGRALSFSGSKTDVNNALATLEYRSNTPAAVEFTASIGSADMVYYPGNGHVYEVVTPEEQIDWAEANSLAQARTFNGASGYLATITDQDENDYITARMNGDGWFGASDAGSEGDWKWVTGPEAGTSFWSGLGDGSGSSVDGEFSNWADGEPNNAGDEDCAQFYGSGSGWNDLPCGDGVTLASYVVEYGDDELLPTAPSSTSFTITTATPTPNPVSVSTCEAFFDELADKNDNRYNTINVTQDLDCTGYDLTALFSEYDYDEDQPLGFAGTFNGNGHTISNLTIEPRYDAYYDELRPAGLFGYVNGATITDVSFTNLSVTGDDCVGGVVGYADNLTLSNVSVNGTIGGDEVTDDQVGGLVGCLYEVNGSSSLTDSSFSGVVEANGSSVGGIVGYTQVGNGNSLTLSSLNNTGTVTGGSNRIAGIVGQVEAWDGTISIEDNTSVGVIDTDSSEVAGIIGSAYVYNDVTLTIRGNSVTSNVSGEGTAGAIIGSGAFYNDALRVTIADSVITHDVTSQYGNAGGVAGYIEAESYEEQIITIEDMTVSGNVSGNSGSGGLIGQISGYTEGDDVYVALVNQSRVTGSVSTNNGGMGGGLIGQAQSVRVTKSYSTAAVDTGMGPYGGGLVGHGVFVAIEDSYARGPVNSSVQGGGLVGYSVHEVAITHSYATGAVQSNSGPGGFVANGSATVDGGYWDTQTSGQQTSVSGEGKTTAEMMRRATYADWDFATVWAKASTVNDGYPCLRWTGACENDEDDDGVSSAVEAAAPNSGDGNYDGQPDADQSNVASLVNTVTGKYLTLEVSDTCTLSDVTVAAAGSISTKDENYQYTNGLLNFNASCGDPGVTISVKQYYHGVESVEGLVARKFNPNTQEYKTVTGHSLSLTVEARGGQNVAVLTYNVTDGDDLDTDGVVNGTIIDPIGLASSTAGSPNTGFFAQALKSGAVASIGLVVIVVTAAAGLIFGGFVAMRRIKK